MTGGWWVARTAFLQKWDYPFRELQHNGGDVILGELCRQQDAFMLSWHSRVTVNKAARRGEKTLRPFEPPQITYEHHNFVCDVQQLPKGNHDSECPDTCSR
jgi:hypothetical protein